MTTAGPVSEQHARVTAHLAARIPGLDMQAAQSVLAAARADRGRALWELDAHLRQHPDVLAITAACYPLALVRVAHVLIGAGYPGVVAPACAGCGKVTADLRRTSPSGRVCGSCAARQGTGPCARCGQVRRINARRPDGGICSACYAKDAEVVQECSGCGRLRRPAARLPDGSARCQSCATRPARICSACGQPRTVAKVTGAGPVCAACYQQPRRQCGRCGHLRTIAKRAAGDSPDLCHSCYKGATAVCATCGEIRPCHRISSGSPICRRCRARPRRRCFRCRRDRPVQAEWPAGPVCSGCYEHVRRHPAPCAGCLAVRPLIGVDEQGSQVCGPCAGAAGLDYACRECGRGGELHSDHRCFRCVLAERTRALLAGPGGEVPSQLLPLLAAFTAVSKPATVVAWLGKSRSADLLGRLAKSGQPLTHDTLDRLPQTQSLHYIREVLVNAGVLEPRNEHLERLAPWLEHLLHDQPASYARLVRPYAHWFILRRARRAAAGRAFTRGSADFARARVLAVLDLLSWLDQRHQSLHDLTQADVDQWLSEGTTTRRAVRYFLQWAHARDLTGDLSVPLPPRPQPVRLLDEEDHARQLDRCLTDDSMPLDLRVGGALVLLFGMLVSRITQLTKNDIVDDGTNIYLAIDGHRLMLPPRLASLVRQLRDEDPSGWTLSRLGTPAPWLFPGRSPGRPAVDVLFGVRLQRHHINAHAGRNTARLALAAELPASVLADLTGISISTAERWSQWAKRDWATYIAVRAADQYDGGERPNGPSGLGKYRDVLERDT